MSHLELNQEEIDQIENGKIVVVRPSSTKVKKGENIEIEGEKIMVLDVREYPRAEDLFKLEQLDWIATGAEDIVDAVKETEDQYPDAEGFVAIELARK